MVTVAHICVYTKNHWSVYFKWVNCMVYDLDLNKTVKICFGKKRKRKSKGSLREPCNTPKSPSKPLSWCRSAAFYRSHMDGWAQVQPEQRESPQAWATSPVLWDSSWNVGKRQGRRLSRKLGRRLSRRANNVQNLASCTAALWNTEQKLSGKCPTGTDYPGHYKAAFGCYIMCHLHPPTTLVYNRRGDF